MEDLTLKQKEVFKQIKKFLETKGYSPSVRELCNLCNVSSPATMQEHIKHLEEKGYITKSKNNSRTIRIKLDFNNNDLQARIDKAIEYIRSQYTITDDDLYLALYSSDGTLDKLESILRGEDKE